MFLTKHPQRPRDPQTASPSNGAGPQCNLTYPEIIKKVVYIFFKKGERAGRVHSIIQTNISGDITDISLSFRQNILNCGRRGEEMEKFCRYKNAPRYLCSKINRFNFSHKTKRKFNKKNLIST